MPRGRWRRRLEIGAWCLGFSHRALNMMIDHVTQRKTFGTLLADRTAFVVAHRLSTIHRANRILVLDKGQLVEEGTHAQLMSADGRYAHLARLQFTA